MAPDTPDEPDTETQSSSISETDSAVESSAETELEKDTKIALKDLAKGHALGRRTEAYLSSQLQNIANNIHTASDEVKQGAKIMVSQMSKTAVASEKPILKQIADKVGLDNSAPQATSSGPKPSQTTSTEVEIDQSDYDDFEYTAEDYPSFEKIQSGIQNEIEVIESKISEYDPTVPDQANQAVKSQRQLTALNTLKEAFNDVHDQITSTQESFIQNLASIVDKKDPGSSLNTLAESIAKTIKELPTFTKQQSAIEKISNTLESIKPETFLEDEPVPEQPIETTPQEPEQNTQSQIEQPEVPEIQLSDKEVTELFDNIDQEIEELEQVKSYYAIQATARDTPSELGQKSVINRKFDNAAQLVTQLHEAKDKLADGDYSAKNNFEQIKTKSQTIKNETHQDRKTTHTILANQASKVAKNITNYEKNRAGDTNKTIPAVNLAEVLRNDPKNIEQIREKLNDFKQALNYDKSAKKTKMRTTKLARKLSGKQQTLTSLDVIKQTENHLKSLEQAKQNGTLDPGFQTTKKSAQTSQTTQQEEKITAETYQQAGEEYSQTQYEQTQAVSHKVERTVEPEQKVQDILSALKEFQEDEVVSHIESSLNDYLSEFDSTSDNDSFIENAPDELKPLLNASLNNDAAVEQAIDHFYDQQPAINIQPPEQSNPQTVEMDTEGEMLIQELSDILDKAEQESSEEAVNVEQPAQPVEESAAQSQLDESEQNLKNAICEEFENTSKNLADAKQCLENAIATYQGPQTAQSSETLNNLLQQFTEHFDNYQESAYIAKHFMSENPIETEQILNHDDTLQNYISDIEGMEKDINQLVDNNPEVREFFNIDTPATEQEAAETEVTEKTQNIGDMFNQLLDDLDQAETNDKGANEPLPFILEQTEPSPKVDQRAEQPYQTTIDYIEKNHQTNPDRSASAINLAQALQSHDADYISQALEKFKKKVDYHSTSKKAQLQVSKIAHRLSGKQQDLTSFDVIKQAEQYLNQLQQDAKLSQEVDQLLDYFSENLNDAQKDELYDFIEENKADIIDAEGEELGNNLSAILDEAEQELSNEMSTDNISTKELDDILNRSNLDDDLEASNIEKTQNMKDGLNNVKQDHQQKAENEAKQENEEDYAPPSQSSP